MEDGDDASQDTHKAWKGDGMNHTVANKDGMACYVTALKLMTLEVQEKGCAPLQVPSLREHMNTRIHMEW